MQLRVLEVTDMAGQTNPEKRKQSGEEADIVQQPENKPSLIENSAGRASILSSLESEANAQRRNTLIPLGWIGLSAQEYIENSKLYRQGVELKYSKERILFYFELVMISCLFLIDVIIIFGPFPRLLKLGAAGHLFYMGRKLLKHITKTD
jgi:hypothetical protein